MIQQPATLASIPSILARTALRLVARVVFVLAALVLLVGAGLALFSLLIATWRTPRTSRVQLAVDIALAVTQLVKGHAG